jgi:hypothetical protein
MITFLHALWGDELVASWPKALRDAQWGVSWRNQPDIECNRLVFAYGHANYRWLELFGLEPILAHEDAIVDFDGIGNREHEGRGSRGVFNYGLSAWQHKSHAIQLAFAEHNIDEAIWLDWDTQYHNREQLDWFEQLKEGPPFQGRMRYYKRKHSGGGRHRVYHGGCYYLRNADVFIESNHIRKAAPYVTDEATTTTAVNNLYFDGRDAAVEEHRAKGLDNPKLHSLRINGMAGKFKSLFYEGTMARSPPFEVGVKNPIIEYTH